MRALSAGPVDRTCRDGRCGRRFSNRPRQLSLALRARTRRLRSPVRRFGRGTAMASLKDKHIVITGGTGALGSAVAKALVEAGAHCHVPAIETSVPADRFPKNGVSVTTHIDLSDEAAVEGF